MANIRVDLKSILTDGQMVTIKAPCDCTAVEGITVYYPKNGERVSKAFVMKDSHGNNLTGVGNLFMAGSYVTVILDSVNGFAYLQNADTNKYLEEKMKPEDSLDSDSTEKSLSAKRGKELKAMIQEVEDKMAVTTTALDMSLWDSGSFTETLSDGTTKEHTVTFDSDGKPTAIDGMTIVW